MSTFDENNADGYVTTNFYEESGKVDTSKTRLMNVDTLKLVHSVVWKSEWHPDEFYQDFIKIYRTVEGYWVVYDYECGGYSSVTYEPTQVACVMKSDNFEAFWNMVLTENQRERLFTMRTHVGKMLYV